MDLLIIRCDAETCSWVEPEYSRIIQKYPNIKWKIVNWESLNINAKNIITKTPSFLIYNNGTLKGVVAGPDLVSLQKYLE